VSEQRIRVIVIDDHPLVHQGVAAVAALHEDLEFAGAAATTDEGLRLLAQQPDVAVVDLRLSGFSGLNLIEEGRRTAPGCRFVLLSSILNPAAVRRAMELGVTAVLSKEAPPEDMVTAIRRAAQGRSYVDPSVMDVVLAPVGGRGGLEQLTDRQLDVLAALARGMGTQQIADHLSVAESTVKKHISEILAKLGLADRTQAALYAVAQGLVDVSELQHALGSGAGE